MAVAMQNLTDKFQLYIPGQLAKGFISSLTSRAGRQMGRMHLVLVEDFHKNQPQFQGSMPGKLCTFLHECSHRPVCIYSKVCGKFHIILIKDISKTTH